MIQTYRIDGQRLVRQDPADGFGSAIWIDLCDPTAEEEQAVEHTLGLDIPTRQELAEIEESARLYLDGDAIVTTIIVAQGITEGHPTRGTATFLLLPDRLVTVRYSDPMPFRTFMTRLERQGHVDRTAVGILLALLEAVVERTADILETVSADLNGVSLSIFYDGAPGMTDPKGPPDLQATVKLLGRKNHTLAVVRESMVTIGRLTAFLRLVAHGRFKNGPGIRLKTLDRDLKSLAAFEAQLEQQISYLHEATTGLINIEQNAIIKVFSIAAVLFLPPTLVGTVYGMNFEAMPELDWQFGYPVALLAMLVSAIIPYLWFKWRGWL